MSLYGIYGRLVRETAVGIGMLEERVGDIDRMVGAALQVVDHICKEDTADGVAFVIHKTLNVIIDKVGLQVIYLLFQVFCFRQ